MSVIDLLIIGSFIVLGITLYIVSFKFIFKPLLRYLKYRFRLPFIQSFYLKKYLPEFDLQSLKYELFNRFYLVQVAWMNFDYSSLRKLCSPELYESYRSDLESLSAKKQKNAMNEFQFFKNSYFLRIQEKNHQLIIHMVLKAKFKDYIKNSITNKTIPGKFAVVHPEYFLEFRIDLQSHEVHCPNCGSLLLDSICDYCHTDGLKYSNHDIVLYQKYVIPWGELDEEDS